MTKVVKWENVFFKNKKEKENRVQFVGIKEFGTNVDGIGLNKCGRFVGKDSLEVEWFDSVFTFENWGKVIEVKSFNDKWRLFFCLDDDGTFTFARHRIIKK